MPDDLIKDNQYNIGHLCTRHQCEMGRANKLAVRFVAPSLEFSDFTFADLEIGSNKFANALAALGFARGDVFFTFLPKMPEQLVAFLGALKLQLITGTLFANFGEEALLDRLGDARAKGLITKRSYLKKIARIREQLPSLRTIIVTESGAHLGRDILSYRQLMEDASAVYATPLTSPETPSVLHYTSGSTGKPKGVLHVHKSVLSQARTAREVLQLGTEDRFWCTADQGWVTGTSYGIIGSWSLGITQVHFGGAYDAQSWLSVLEREKVTVLYTAPTALRMLMREDPGLFARFDLRHLRYIFSVGEPLNPEVIHWSRELLGRDVYDTWFQTETGAIMIANRPGLPIKPGSMGKPVPGIDAAIVEDDGTPLADGVDGNLGLRPGWPSMFATYFNNPQAYGQKFKNGYYLSGDTAYRDQEGYYWFRGRSDDVINTAGHLVSPFEVESALLEIPEVAESAVIGAPDETLYEKVVAFVTLHRQYEWTNELELRLRLHVSNRVSSIATPQVIVVCADIPKNKSGKIMRRVLKARYLGAEAGDISTLEA